MAQTTAQINVVKDGGGTEPFSKAKVENALRRAGLNPKETDEAVKRLIPKLYDAITTKKIYAILYELIDEMRPEVSHRYNLKRALFEIGPEGYEFEDFIGRLLSLEGYRTELRQIVDGRCVSHEVDVIAAKGNKAYMIECKFHNQYGARCRIQTALYVYARFLDIKEGAAAGMCRSITHPWLITNTKFSEDVIKYAECKGFPLLGWRYPLKEGLESLIDRNKCYPITVLPMGRDVLGRMLAKKIVTVFDIPESAEKLSDMTGIPLAKAKEVVERAEYAR